MVFYRAALRGHPREVARAGMDVEHALAMPALEVVVVELMSDEFEARVFARQVRRLEFTLCHQQLEVTVDRGDTQARHVVPCGVQHLMAQQRTIGLGDGVANGAALPCIALHTGTLAESRPL